MKFEGIYTPVITPCDAMGRIDYPALKKLLEHLVSSGVHGVVSGGFTGENYSQTVEERPSLARFTREVLAA